MYECFHCGNRLVVWDSDFDFSDLGYEGDGIVHFCHYVNCGAEIDMNMVEELVHIMYPDAAGLVEKMPDGKWYAKGGAT